ncbi:MAG: class I SAM-dependent methyltransferase [Spirochaetales bacterium]|nr:MAG: class I SAM-dependent methyltransferase [Spirochaetales bacterium]
MTSKTLQVLAEARQRPELRHQPSTRKLWTDPHLANQMLQAHLDPAHDAASYRHDLIDAAVCWLYERFALNADSEYLDLGCGPGLYTQRMADRGVRVTGVDFSENSIRYAQRVAVDGKRPIDYRCINYLDIDFDGQFDLATIIWCDINVLAPDDLVSFLRKVRRALKVGGHFVFDFVTDLEFNQMEEKRSWTYYPETGFFSTGPHLVLEDKFTYPEELVTCDRFTILRPDQEPDRLFLWHHYHRLDDMIGLLSSTGMSVAGIYDRIDGTSFSGEGKKVTLAVRNGP